MSIPSVLKNFNLFVDGRGKAGVAAEINLPKLTLKTDEHLAGGMDVPVDIDLGMEKLTTDFTLNEYSPDTLKLFGLADGASTPLTFRGAVTGDAGVIVPVVVSMRGMLTEVDPGTAKVGEKTAVKFTASLRYYKLTYDGNDIHEIDADNMKRIIGGVDQLEAERAAIGL